MDEELPSTDDKFVEQTYELAIDRALFNTIREDYYMQQCQILEDGKTVRVRVTTKYQSDIDSLVLGQPESICVLGPDIYKQKVYRIVKRLTSLYAGPGAGT